MAVTTQNAITLARKVASADASARSMADYQTHPDFAPLREVADAARQLLWDAGVRRPDIEKAAAMTDADLPPLADAPNDTVDALMLAEEFISGFEDDETQEGIGDILAGLRAAIQRETAAPDMLAALHAVMRCARGELERPITQRQPWAEAQRLIEAAIAKAEAACVVTASASMANPMETLDWLSVQFRDRANEDPAEHTEQDAREVEAARDAMRDMLAALKSAEADFGPDFQGPTIDAIRAAIAKAEGH